MKAIHNKNDHNPQSITCPQNWELLFYLWRQRHFGDMKHGERAHSGNQIMKQELVMVSKKVTL